MISSKRDSWERSTKLLIQSDFYFIAFLCHQTCSRSSKNDENVTKPAVVHHCMTRHVVSCFDASWIYLIVPQKQFVCTAKHGKLSKWDIFIILVKYAFIVINKHCIDFIRATTNILHHFIIHKTI